MRRRLFTLASAVSLLLSLVTVALWMRSMWMHDEISLVKPQLGVSIISLHGRIQVEMVSTDRPAYVESWKWTHKRIGGALDEIQDRFSWRFGGFWFFEFDGFSVSGTNSFTASGRTFVIPDWFLIGLYAVPPLWAFRSIRRRALKNHCSECGYDLTANISGVCPECGTPYAV